jgi:predicted CopG family antitoxin
MTTEYKTLRVPKPDYEKARESKEESETWGEFLQRCSENPPETVEFVEVDKTTAHLEDVLRTIEERTGNVEQQLEDLSR